MTEWVINLLGVVALVAGGLFVSGLLLGFACDYVWRKLRDAYSLAEVVRVVRKNGKKPGVPLD